MYQAMSGLAHNKFWHFVGRAAQFCSPHESRMPQTQVVLLVMAYSSWHSDLWLEWSRLIPVRFLVHFCGPDGPRRPRLCRPDIHLRGLGLYPNSEGQ